MRIPIKIMKEKNMKLTHICFDLDGTLVDSRDTIHKATLKALSKIGVRNSIPEDNFANMIGMHFIDIFKEFGVEVKDFQKFISVYKSVYFDFIDDSVLYPDVANLLGELSSNGMKTSLLTTKSQDQAEKIVDYFSIREELNYVMGRRDGIAHKPSAEPLLEICNELNVQPAETLIVGDTELDIQCGKNAGAKTCGVLYGYRTEKQIKEEEPDYIIRRINELKDIV